MMLSLHSYRLVDIGLKLLVWRGYIWKLQIKTITNSMPLKNVSLLGQADAVRGSF